jgi:exodeoxyribonuclease VII small subunit
MTDEPEPTFEDALNRIERIVADLERGEPALSAALAKYEDGVKLLRHCYDLLDRAERSVALLTGVDEQGHPVTTPFDARATASPEPDPSPAAANLEPRPGGRAPRSSSRSRSASGGTPPPPSDPPF